MELNPEALRSLENSIELAARAGAQRQRAWSMSLVGRAHQLCGRTSDARRVLTDCLELVHEERWTAFAPWPETLRADVDLAEHRVDAARDRYTHAYALACQLRDPCWEGVSAKGLAMVEAHAGEVTPALSWLDDARSRCVRWPDAYQWVHASVLDATCEVALGGHDAQAPVFVELLAALASRTAMRELVVRSHLHRAGLDIPGALDAAVMAAAEIENPALHDLVRGAADAVERAAGTVLGPESLPAVGSSGEVVGNEHAASPDRVEVG